MLLAPASSVLLTWLGLTGAVAADDGREADLTVPVPAGETCLNDIGAYRVGWQSYGRAAEMMPVSWSGHFSTPCGISYQDWGQVSGRRGLLMHSPWRGVPPGRTWAEYRLALPPMTPMRLSFGIAMGPDVATPDKSDGVTFSAYLTADGREQELLRRHHDKADWIDNQWDLAPHAGKTVLLRLQVEPGPKNNASFDYAFFGDAQLTVGSVTESRSARLRHLMAKRARQATATASLAGSSNASKQGVAPSNRLPCQTSLELVAGVWRFRYEAADGRIVYAYRPATGTLDDFTVQVDDGPPFSPARGGGATAIVKEGQANNEVPLRGGRAVTLTQNGATLIAVWEYAWPEKGTGTDRPDRSQSPFPKPVRIEWTFRLVGKALVVTARGETPVVSRFALGEATPVPIRKLVAIPYLAGHLHYLPAQDVFVGRYLDWTVSHASHCPQGVATYEPRTDGTRNPLVESGYVTVSPDLCEVLPNIPHPPSPFLDVLGPRLMLDIWGHAKGTYASDAAAMRTLKDHGVDHVAIIQHDWQRFGYDVKLPDHIPANPAYGGDAGMAEFGKAANECGYLWSVHENYIDLYPDAPSYDPQARVLHADGTPSPAWYNPGTKVQSFGLKCNRALGYARQNAPEIQRRYATTAAYLDVHTCVPPWHQLDHEANQPQAAMALAKVKSDTELFQFMRDTHGGPLLGEGANHFYWAGPCDGVEAQVAGAEDHAPLLDFDLLKIHPQMVNHGMGYYERWFRRGYNHQWGRDTGTMEQIDKYRAQTVAYGHAGFISTPQVWNVQWVAREHHLTHPVQRLYGTAKAIEIAYEVDGQFVPAGVAVTVGETRRQRIRYDSGLTVWVNWRAEPWTVEGRVLPQWGFVALGPETEVCSSRRVDGKHADYAECPEFLFADARTHFDMPYRESPRKIEPRLREFEYLRGNRARVTYEWVVNEPLTDDYHCFVHGVHADTEPNQGIEFQQDHGLPRPTSQWRVGETIVDGPHEIALSGQHDTYDLRVGLHKGPRLLLTGPQDNERRVVVARLKLDRKDGQISNITATAPSRDYRPNSVPDADFTVRLNPPGTWIDFGKVATDGSVKISREPNRLILFPYPRDKQFRVSLDLKAIAPGADPQRIQVRALAAGTQKDIGPVPFELTQGRLVLSCGVRDAGRYAVTWRP